MSWNDALASLGGLAERRRVCSALWPSKFTNYSVANSPYKDGKGDIVMEFVTACRQHGIKPGLYIAAGCDAYHHCGPHPAQSAEEYKAMQNGMVAELVGGKYDSLYN